MEDISSNPIPQTTPIVCEKCNHNVFVPAYFLRKVSRLLIGASEDGVVPVNTFACAKCGHVNEEFIPHGIEVEEEPQHEEEQKSSLILQ